MLNARRKKCRPKSRDMHQIQGSRSEIGSRRRDCNRKNAGRKMSKNTHHDGPMRTAVAYIPGATGGPMRTRFTQIASKAHSDRPCAACLAHNDLRQHNRCAQHRRNVEAVRICPVVASVAHGGAGASAQSRTVAGKLCGVTQDQTRKVRQSATKCAKRAFSGRQPPTRPEVLHAQINVATGIKKGKWWKRT